MQDFRYFATEKLSQIPIRIILLWTFREKKGIMGVENNGGL